MGRAYSMDLRLRVLRDSAAGLSSKELAVRYHVSRAWVDAPKQRQRETGDPAPRKQTPILTPVLAKLEALIQEQPDRTLQELQEALTTAVSLATIWRAVGRLGYTVSKNGTRVRTSPARLGGGPRPVADPATHPRSRAARLSR